MQRMDLVEKSGTGYLRIKKALKKYKMPDPIIETNEHWFTITFKRPDLQKMTIRERLESETVQKTTQKTTQKILDLLKENPYFGRKEIAEKLGSISESGVKYNLDKLKKNGTIKRIGPDKGGYWEIITK
jgi:ATP-dependent DNA helicase RecG